ncbi:hypothetical protein GCM10027445_63490 [Amycolatopsis endophytica]|uniref:Uncharacterized protein n=1 Tax=Amycolatopsis endophytica TaxID=860233 RepID=A0A853BDV8_9PSEU|nr:hypothetical protein [Amycolatopsis endophytica]NYI92852.1 hypothetical protein [Amycolatopsis endophytica]
MDLPPLPASVTSLVASGKLPPDVAALFTPAGEEDWSGIAAAAEELLAGEVAADVRGPLALAAAYGHLDDIEFTDSGEMTERNDRAIALIDEAWEHGVPAEDLGDLTDFTHRVQDVAHLARDTEDYVVKHGATAATRLNRKLEQAHALYEAGDRAAALPLFRDVAEADVWGEFSGASDRSDIGWCRLLQDAAYHEGPEATRKIWQEAKASRHAARFPYPPWSCPLIEMLVGTGVPDLLEILASERLALALRDDDPWELTEDERWTLSRAIDEVEQYDRA